MVLNELAWIAQVPIPINGMPILNPGGTQMEAYLKMGNVSPSRLGKGSRKYRLTVS